MGFKDDGLNFIVDTAYGDAGNFILKVSYGSDSGPNQKQATVTFGSASISGGYSGSNLSSTETFTFTESNVEILGIDLYDSSGSVKLAEKSYDSGSYPTLADGGEVDVTIFKVK